METTQPKRKYTKKAKPVKVLTHFLLSTVNGAKVYRKEVSLEDGLAALAGRKSRLSEAKKNFEHTTTSLTWQTGYGKEVLSLTPIEK